MNHQNLEEKAQEASQPSLFRGEKCGNELVPERMPAFLSARWGSAPCLGPHDPQEAHLHMLGADGERISLTNSCTKVLAHDEDVCQEASWSVVHGEAPGRSWVSDKMGLLDPEYLYNTAQAQRVQPPVLGEWRYDRGDAIGHAVLHLEEGCEMRGESPGTGATPDALDASAAQGSLPHPRLPCGQATAAPFCSSEMCLRGEKLVSEELGIPLEDTAKEPCEVPNTTYLIIPETAMQIDAPHSESPSSLEKTPVALTNGFHLDMTNPPEPHLEGCNGSYTPPTEKAFDSYEDQPNGEPPLQTLCVPVMPPSGCCPEADCPVDRPPFSDAAEQLCHPGDQLNETASPDNDVGIRSHPAGTPLAGSHLPGWDTAPSPGSPQEGSDVGCGPPAIPGCPNETFSVSLPEKAKEKPEKEKNTRELVRHPNKRLAPIKSLKPALGKVLGKPAPKPGSPAVSSLHKIDKVSFPGPNFKNVKAKVISRASSAVAATQPRLPPGSPPTEPPSSGGPRRAEWKASAKADVLPSKSRRQHLLKLVTSQVVHVTTHSRSASQEAPRVAPEPKASHRGGIPRASLPRAGRLHGAGAGAAAMGFCKGTEAPDIPMRTVESAPPEPRAPTSDGASPGDVAVPLGTQEEHREVVTSPSACTTVLASTLNSPPVAGRNRSKHDPLGLSKIPVPKMKVWPSASCWRRSITESRNFHAERALSPQRTRRVSSSGASRKSVSPSLVAVLSTVEKGKQRNPRTSCSTPQPSPDALSTEKALGLASYRAQCEHQGKVILHLKQLLAGGNCKLEALTVVIQHLLSEREEARKQHQVLSQELVSLRGELVTTSAACEKLEKARNELQTACQAFVDKLNLQHQADLAELESQLKAHYTGECERLQSVCVQEVQKYQAQLQSQVDDLNAAHEAFKLEIESSHAEQVDLLKKAYEASLTEIKECHGLEKTSLEELFSEKRESLEKEIHDLKSKNDALNEKLQLEEQKAASREKANQKNPQIMYLEQELESLKAVLEIKNEKLHQQDIQLLKMEKLVDNNTALVDKLKKVEQENEELKARMDKHMAISRQLSTEQAVLQESLEKESKVNKRLSMENEELLWKLHNGDLCSPKKSPPSMALPFSSPRNSASFPSPTGSPR